MTALHLAALRFLSARAQSVPGLFGLGLSIRLDEEIDRIERRQRLARLRRMNERRVAIWKAMNR